MASKAKSKKTTGPRIYPMAMESNIPKTKGICKL